MIAVPSPNLSLRYEHVTEYTHLPEITRQQVEHFSIDPGDDRRGRRVGVIGQQR